jgi:formylglycine-generating enzyme required for sulfatase activity
MLRALRVLAWSASLLAMAGAAEAQTVLRLNELAPEAGPEGAALHAFSSEVAAATQGSVRIDLHFDAVRDNASTSIENIMSGQLDMFSGDLRFMLPLMIDEVTGLDLPFLIPDNAAAQRYLASPLIEEARQKVLDYRRIRFLSMSAFRGPERMMAATRPVEALGDLNGMKLAIFPGPTKAGVQLWLALGVKVVEVDWADVPAALQQHRIDGVIAPDLPSLVAAGIAQVAPNIGPARDHPQIWMLTINEADWQKLTLDQQAAVTRAAQDATATFVSTTQQAAAQALTSVAKDPGYTPIALDSLAAHDRLFGTYNALISAGAAMPRVRDTAAAAIERPAGTTPSFPVGVGQAFQDCPTCPVMVVLPAGTFEMGSPADEKGRFDNEGPQHEVVVSHPLAISKYPVTMGELRAWQPGRGPDPVDDDPAVMVTWDDGGKYTAWLSQKTGRHYHLPTESEYEYAERAGTTTPYYWGDSIGVNNANCFGCGSKFDGKGSSPVGSFPPNRFGLYDLTGNVFEWVEDCYFDTEQGAPRDAFVARESTGGACGTRVLRSSSWFNLPSFLRSAYRFHELPDARNSRRSFRVVID